MFTRELNFVYSDELVTVSELNSQPGRVLDKALEHWVTIIRHDQSFALLRRDKVTALIKATELSRYVLELLNTAYRLLLQEKISAEHPCGWLGVFDSEDLQDFVAEINDAYQSTSMSDEAWTELQAIIHEWHESALAISSPEIAAAFNAESDEVPLTKPIIEGAA